MKRAIGILGLVATIGALGGCASGGGGDGAAIDRYNRDFGRLLLPTLDEARNKIWTKHNYFLQRQELQFSQIYFESQWRTWHLNDPAAYDNPSESRIRIILRGRRVGEELDGTGVYRVTFEGEQEVRGGRAPDWHPIPVTPAAREEFEKVAGDLALEVRTGVRR